MDEEKIDLIFYKFFHYNPNPRIELNYVNHFTLLIAIILSAQTTDIKVNKVTGELFKIADNPHKMLLLNEENLKSHIKSIGLYNSKAKNIINLCHILIELHNAEIPRDFLSLIKLPGVGRKSANVFLNSAFGKCTMGVDTHVFRVSNRIGLVNEKNVLSTELALIRVIPKKWLSNAHQWLVLHGRYICKARKPLCAYCIINNLCEYSKKHFICKKLN